MAEDLARFRNLVAGSVRDAAGGEWLESLDPATGEAWALIPRCTSADVDAAVEAARTAFRSPEWRGMTATARGALLYRFADILAEEGERLAQLETQDDGKLIAEL